MWYCWYDLSKHGANIPPQIATKKNDENSRIDNDNELKMLANSKLETGHQSQLVERSHLTACSHVVYSCCSSEDAMDLVDGC